MTLLGFFWFLLAIIGAFIIGVLRNGLNMAGTSAFVQQIIIGIVVIGAVYIDQIRNRR